ncbi:MAG: MarR family transcriptional regulator/GNAT family N-acetyltransferase [Saprospiraceae bacterium]|nr:MarR family transcriptional regulator/GNAT family N-acetyltransferase [Saprospiraceae bacterium]
MKNDYLKDLGYLGVISRIKRLSDQTMASGRALYDHIDIGIEANWFLIFRIIMERGQTTVSEIASVLHFAHPSVINIVQKMDKSGYLQITSDPSDNRKRVIKLSEKALSQLPEMERVWEACEAGVKSIFQSDNFLAELAKVEQALAKESFFHRVLNHLEDEEIAIKPFAKGDERSFADLNLEWIKSYFRVEPIDEKMLGNPEKHIREKGGSIFMAKKQGVIVGTVALLPAGEDEIELGRMAVHPEFRGLGIGSKLLRTAIGFARTNGSRCIILYSNKRLKPALHLYKKYGFEEVALEQTEYKRANIKMRLDLCG